MVTYLSGLVQRPGCNPSPSVSAPPPRRARGFSEAVLTEFTKMAATSLSSNTLGQAGRKPNAPHESPAAPLSN